MEQNPNKQGFHTILNNDSMPTKSSQTFKLLQNEVQHTSRLVMKHSDHNSHEVLIKNKITTKKGCRITKKTSIFIGSKVINILDKYSSCELLQSITSNIKFKATSFEKHIKFGHDKIIKQKSKFDSKKSIKYQASKNLIKNIFKLFLRWLEVNSAQDLGFDLKLTKMIAEKRGFNRSLVNDVSKKPQLRRAFLNFCNQDAEEWIDGSKIRDKMRHLTALKRYKKLFQQEQNLESSRSISSSFKNFQNDNVEASIQHKQHSKASSDQREDDLVNIFVINNRNSSLQYTREIR